MYKLYTSTGLDVIDLLAIVFNLTFTLYLTVTPFLRVLVNVS